MFQSNPILLFWVNVLSNILQINIIFYLRRFAILMNFSSPKKLEFEVKFAFGHETRMLAMLFFVSVERSGKIFLILVIRVFMTQFKHSLKV